MPGRFGLKPGDTANATPLSPAGYGDCIARPTHGRVHDGRARNLLEAIRWHGEDAQARPDAVIAMPQADHAALLRFLESL
ncbi:di-heme oxidoredictase family protein [Chachezhania antarctica]|uniref:di-heme oxidoredictase family protein n=1 Tax=Chachezhania antarctica TaxID=2340860 RepID=UPI000EAB94C8|nr:di-heme oxidoredictase family protein [Chachezhania antarctica]|tara:strand:+ start:1126 stop:1365 length:240 start_codon:yes stop_codon:yes gene_type:complete